MSTTQTLKTGPRPGPGMPRWQGILFGAVGFPLAHAVIPWGLSLLTRRYGWRGRRPGRLNLSGLPLVVAGTAYAGWGLALHFAEGWQWERAQRYLFRGGPYRFSRNPMYVGELAIWLGWVIFYGSSSVLLMASAFGLWLDRVGVPQEEEALEERFGEAYRSYKRSVPRWLGMTR